MKANRKREVASFIYSRCYSESEFRESERDEKFRESERERERWEEAFFFPTSVFI